MAVFASGLKLYGFLLRPSKSLRKPYFKRQHIWLGNLFFL